MIENCINNNEAYGANMVNTNVNKDSGDTSIKISINKLYLNICLL